MKSLEVWWEGRTKSTTSARMLSLPPHDGTATSCAGIGSGSGAGAGSGGGSGAGSGAGSGSGAGQRGTPAVVEPGVCSCTAPPAPTLSSSVVSARRWLVAASAAQT